VGGVVTMTEAGPALATTLAGILVTAYAVEALFLPRKDTRQ
jgi:hypothetical protein